MFADTENTSWYVVQTRSRHEKKSTELLSAAGIPVFLPLRKTRRTWSDRVREVQLPLFPGYLFVRFTEADRYRILNTPGISRFVSFGGQYASVSARQLKAIEKAAAFENAVEVTDLSLAPGQEVFISSGPFKGYHARLVQHNGRGKLLLAVESIGQGILLEIGRTRVEQIPVLSGN